MSQVPPESSDLLLPPPRPAELRALPAVRAHHLRSVPDARPRWACTARSACREAQASAPRVTSATVTRLRGAARRRGPRRHVRSLIAINVARLRRAVRERRRRHLGPLVLRPDRARPAVADRHVDVHARQRAAHPLQHVRAVHLRGAARDGRSGGAATSRCTSSAGSAVRPPCRSSPPARRSWAPRARSSA